MTLLSFAILATAVQYVLGASKLSQPVRTRLPALARTLLECPPCCGTWLGLGAHWVGLSAYPGSAWLAWCMSGAAGMVLVAIGRSLMNLGVVET